MKTVGALLLVGCFNTYQVPTAELYNLNLRPGADAHVANSDGDDVTVSSGTDVTFITDDGKRTTLQLKSAQISGNWLQGTIRNGAPVQIELPRIAEAEIRKLSGLKTGLLIGGIGLAVLTGVIVGIVVANANGDL